jgi:hypothetical protein
VAATSAFSDVFDNLRQTGRHFAIAAGLPSVIVTTYTAVLLAAGAPTHQPGIRIAAARVKSIGLADVGLLVVIVLAVGLILAPFQYALTQVLEGYWGTSTLAQRGMARSAKRHLDRALYLDDQATQAAWTVGDFDADIEKLRQKEQSLDAAGRLTPMRASRILSRRRNLLHESIPYRLLRQEAERLESRFPANHADVMPTRLGNILRRYERQAGDVYGLDALAVTGLLAQVADPTVRDYYDDARTDLDLGVQMILVWATCTIIGVVLLWQYAIWLVAPLVTCLLTYTAYVGALSTAEAYGEALTTLVALGRVSLYQCLGVRIPRTSTEEVAQNDKLMRQIQGERVTLRYIRRPDGTSAAQFPP